MTRRSIDWDAGLAVDLKNVPFAQEFIQAAIQEGYSVQEVLSKVVRAYGVKEFSAKVKLPSSNILRALHPKSNPTLTTINRLLKPFALQLSVSPALRKKAA